MAWNPSIYSSVLPFPAGGSSATSGGFLDLDLTETLDSSSLGGYCGRVPISRAERMHPLFYGDGFAQAALYDEYPHYFRMFNDLTAAELAAGKTDYRCYFLWDEGSALTGSINLSLVQPRSGVGTISVWRPTPVAGRTERLINETTAPSGAAFTTPTLGSPLALGTVLADADVPLFIRRVIPLGAAAEPYDSFSIQLTGDVLGSTITHSFYYTRRTATRKMAITGARDGKAVLHPYGETYTISITDSSDVAADPAGNIVMVYVTAEVPDDVSGGTAATFMGQASRQGTGDYRFEFRPPFPGFYCLEVDAGGGANVEQVYVEVAAV